MPLQAAYYGAQDGTRHKLTWVNSMGEPSRAARTMAETGGGPSEGATVWPGHSLRARCCMINKASPLAIARLGVTLTPGTGLGGVRTVWVVDRAASNKRYLHADLGVTA